MYHYDEAHVVNKGSVWQVNIAAEGEPPVWQEITIGDHKIDISYGQVSMSIEYAYDGGYPYEVPVSEFVARVRRGVVRPLGGWEE